MRRSCYEGLEHFDSLPNDDNWRQAYSAAAERGVRELLEAGGISSMVDPTSSIDRKVAGIDEMFRGSGNLEGAEEVDTGVDYGSVIERNAAAIEERLRGSGDLKGTLPLDEYGRIIDDIDVGTGMDSRFPLSFQGSGLVKQEPGGKKRWWQRNRVEKGVEVSG